VSHYTSGVLPPTRMSVLVFFERWLFLRHWTFGLTLSLGVIAAGCATGKSDSAWDTRSEYHVMAMPNWSLDPNRPNPTVPIYVVGIEKLSRSADPSVLVHRIEESRSKPCVDNSPNCLRLANIEGDLSRSIEGLLDDAKVGWLTHVVRLTSSGTACLLYSVYDTGPDACELNDSVLAQPAGAAWEGMERLAAAVRRDIRAADGQRAPVTHLVLVATGWNTFQQESARNFTDWAASLKQAGGPNFNPILIGISWQSTWGSMDGAAGSVLSLLSFANKSNDADEVGFTWANQLLNRYLVPIASEQHLSMLIVGHSFGTRITAAALHGHTLLRNLDTTTTPMPQVTFVALQPAFSVNRLQTGRKEAFYTSALPPLEGSKSFYTASEYDKATAKGNAIFGWFGKKPYTSSPQVVRDLKLSSVPGYLAPLERWEVQCAEPSVGCSETGPIKIITPVQRACSQVPLVDASAIVRDVPQGSAASGAHSDVYDLAMADLVIQLMAACYRAGE
jgi:hypothetical protein